MAKAESVFKKVLGRITPGESERRKTEKVLHKINSATEKVIHSKKIGYTLAGSYLRDTWLPDKKEFDIFLLFPASVSRTKLEKEGIDTGRRIVKLLGGKHETAYAEHPYIRATVEGYAVDIVPCYDIKEPGKIKSAVDRTPHHNRYITKKITPRLSSEVRLMKQFCKGAGVYGSDLRVGGFSGYLCELLVIHYGRFKNVLLEASKWVAGNAFVDPEGHFSGDTRKFSNQPLVVIDPVDPKRNVAAALSPANFELFRHSCIKFLKSPSESFFSLSRRNLPLKTLLRVFRKRGTKMIAVSFRRPEVVDDILFPQLRKTARRIAAVLEDADFRVYGHGVWCDERRCVIMLEMETWELPDVRKLVGPPVFSAKHSSEFRKKYEGRSRIWVEGYCWVAETSRRFRRADALLRDVLSCSVKRLRSHGIASYVADAVSGGFAISADENVIRKAGKNSDFSLFLAGYFKKKII